MRVPESIFRKIKRLPGVLWALVALIVFFGISGKGFFTAYNLINICKQGSILVIVSMGTTLAILTAGIDLSTGSVLTLSGVTVGLLIHSGSPISVAILAGLGVGALCGLINGYLIAHLKFHHFIATFGMMGIAQGIALAVTQGAVVPGFDAAFRKLGDGTIFGLPVPVVVALLVVVATSIALYRTRWGAHVYAVGGSEQVAAWSGINTRRVKLAVYVLSGLFAAIAGVVLTARMNSASPIAGAGYEFDAIAAVIIGGTPFEGGRGGIVGTVIGAAVISTLKNGLNIIGLPTPWQITIIGFMITVAIVLDVLYQMRKDRVAS